jgi:predicted transcriptional regulator
LPSIRVSGELRAAVESVLGEGETLSAFLLESVRLNIGRREAQREFIARGLRARDEAGVSGEYVGTGEMLARLDATLAEKRRGRQ